MKHSNRAFDRTLNDPDKPLVRICYAAFKGASLIEPFEPEMTSEVRSTIHSFSKELEATAKQRRGRRAATLRGMTNLRDSLLTIAGVIHKHEITDDNISTEKFILGFLDLAAQVERLGANVGVEQKVNVKMGLVQ